MRAMDSKVLRIFTSAKAAAPMTEGGEIRAFAGKGIEGDRYFSAAGTFSKKEGPGRQITLFEKEALEAVARDYKFEIDPSEMRRNVMVEGVPLNHLVGREFTVGSVRLRGIKLCEPCGHLEKLTGKPVQKAFAHRGGLNCEILVSGKIRVGDAIELEPAEPEDVTEKVSVAKR